MDEKSACARLPSPLMSDEPSQDTAPTLSTPESDLETVNPNPAVGVSPADDSGSDAEVIGVSTAASNALDLVDEVLEALDEDELERAEELVGRLESPDPPDEN